MKNRKFRYMEGTLNLGRRWKTAKMRSPDPEIFSGKIFRQKKDASSAKSPKNPFEPTQTEFAGRPTLEDALSA